MIGGVTHLRRVAGSARPGYPLSRGHILPCKTFQGGVIRPAGVGLVIHQIREKLTLAVTLRHY